MAGKIKVIIGHGACAQGAIAAGLMFYAGYPITPSSEIAEILSFITAKGARIYPDGGRNSVEGAIIRA